jgi:hypothetical protein
MARRLSRVYARTQFSDYAAVISSVERPRRSWERNGWSQNQHGRTELVVGNSNAFIDNQIRPTTPRMAVNDASRILSPRVDCSELFGTSRGPAVLAQERWKVGPCFAYAPGVAQSSGPAAFGLVVGTRGRVDNHSDGVSAFLCAKPEQSGDEGSRLFCIFGSPQLNVEFENRGEIVVEREPAS